MSYVLYLILGLLCISYSSELSENPTANDECAHLWRPDELVGKCFGLKKISEYKNGGIDVPDSSTITSPEACKKLCCRLGDKCVTWQFMDLTKECKLGGPVRLGLEGADNDNWCEPHAPTEWTGRVLKSRNVASPEQLERHPNRKFHCEWGEPLKTQCYGLGPERLTMDPRNMAHFSGTELDKNGDGIMQKGDGGRMGAHGCSRTCCQTEACTHWQELPDRGCYHNNKETPNVHCEKYTGNFVGGRKCFKKYCGGKETENSPSWPMQGPFASNWGQGDRKG